MNNRVKIGISGLSKVAIQRHLPALLKMSKEVEIIGAFDPDISKFDKANVALGTNLKFFNSYQDLCFASDGVIICSPENVRVSQSEIAACEYGCHLMVEEAGTADCDKVCEKYKDILSSIKTVIFYDPDENDLVDGSIYDTFIDDIQNY